MFTVYFAANTASWQRYETPLRRALADAGLQAHLSTECADPSLVDYIIFAPSSEVTDFTPFTRCKAILTQPLCRMVDPGLTAGMVEWVLGHSLRHHLGMDRHILNPAHEWDPTSPPIAEERPVTVLGLGALGQACAAALHAVGFPVTGWSRTPKAVPDLRCFHGPEGLKHALTDAQILILLLPKTASTENILNAESLSWLAEGAAILNPGRGHLIDDAALLAALDTGRVGHATLDVFRTEPLPQDDPYWAHPRVTVTPHIAAETRPVTASRVVVENIRRCEAGEPLLHLVDRARGY